MLNVNKANNNVETPLHCAAHMAASLSYIIRNRLARLSAQTNSLSSPLESLVRPLLRPDPLLTIQNQLLLLVLPPHIALAPVLSSCNLESEQSPAA